MHRSCLLLIYFELTFNKISTWDQAISRSHAATVNFDLYDQNHQHHAQWQQILQLAQTQLEPQVPVHIVLSAHLILKQMYFDYDSRLKP